MVRCNKSQLLAWVLSVTALFLLLQLLFINILKNSSAGGGSNGSNSIEFAENKLVKINKNTDETIQINPRDVNPRFRHRLNENNHQTSASSPHLMSKFLQFKSHHDADSQQNYHTVNELLIPLYGDERKPNLVNMLPFYHKKNSFNFTLVQVSRLDHERPSDSDAPLDNRQIESMRLKSPSDRKDDSYYKNLRGINKQDFELYKPGADGLFKCLNSNQRIPYASLNDDFCDCVDATDEPGTAACHFSVFYCALQNEFLIENFIPSSRVDDKRCDCCDGSDESPDVKCKNSCDEIIQKGKERASVKLKALAEKRKYLAEGVWQNENTYGPKGVFFKLSNKCFKIDRAEYTFEICPYKSATQFKRNDHGDKTDIGNKPSLVKTDKGKWLLKMLNGDAKLCGRPREAEVHFECGVEDSLVSVDESQRCLYVFHLLTPAAC